MDNGSFSNGRGVINKNYPAPDWHRSHTAACMFCRWRCDSCYLAHSTICLERNARHRVNTKYNRWVRCGTREKQWVFETATFKVKFSELWKRVGQTDRLSIIESKNWWVFFKDICVLGTWGLIEGWRRSLRSLTRRRGKDDVLFQGDNAIKPMVKQLVYGHKGLKGSQIK